MTIESVNLKLKKVDKLIYKLEKCNKKYAFQKIRIDGVFDSYGKQLHEGDILKETSYDWSPDLMDGIPEKQAKPFEFVEIYVCKWKKEFACFMFESLKQAYACDKGKQLYHMIHDDNIMHSERIISLEKEIDKIEYALNMYARIEYDTVIVGNIHNKDGEKLLNDLNKKYYYDGKYA